MKVKLVRFSDYKVVIQIQGKPKLIRFELDNNSGFKFCKSNIGSALAILAFPFAAIKGLDLEVPASLNPEVKLNLEQLSVYWCQNRKHLFKRPIVIKPNGFSERSEANPHGLGSLVAFSGGVDSTYALSSFLKNTEVIADLRPKSAMMINGFGYNLEYQELFDKQFLLNQKYCYKKNIDIFSVTTNWKEVAPAYQLFHVLGIVGIMSLFGMQYHAGVVGLDFTFDEELALGAWGNTALISKLLSSNRFLIFPEGGDRSRIEKLEYLFKENEYSHLAVCNSNFKSAANCGRCEKCVRTKLMFLARGIDVLDDMFDDVDVYRHISKIKITKNTQAIFYRSVLEHGSNISEDINAMITQKLGAYESI
ncbi:MAG: hypothetical protein ACTH23_02445 [Moraxellaceae bacterium]